MSQQLLVPDIGDFEEVEVIEVLVKVADKIKKNDEIYECKCNNNFHYECMNDWIKVNAVCPMCKCNINIRKKIDDNFVEWIDQNLTFI